MLRVLKTGALLRSQAKNFAAAVANYSSLPQPQTTPDILYTGVSPNPNSNPKKNKIKSEKHYK